ncbi:NAD(P)-binding protein [Athelia psychrophila]|uniref:NAD(P)-binding protein n=1 Tax=Athelia psychrophila TaxID=1759441 RepID=A0A166V5P0_9AGAM|nr:NAD(P)-binding protein [Fibularhizoctonia sp. CBS 109695]
MPGINDSKCVLVVGATSGIGKSLALAILALASRPTVIIAGRRQDRLDDIISAHGNAGRLEGIQMDVDTDRAALKKIVEDVLAKHPKLDTIIFSAGIQRRFEFTSPESVDLDHLASELNTNYTAIVTMITYFLPHLIKLAAGGQPCFIVPITSGLAMIPPPWVPNYGATKAALHSFSVSLSVQLTDTDVHIMEIFPPLVESEIHDQQGTTEKLSKIWMSLAEFTREAMEGLARGDMQIPVGRSKESFERFEKGKMEIVNMLR